jgi:methionine-rich copper-binding protein CopC
MNIFSSPLRHVPLALAMLGALASPAGAHALLRKAIPAVGSSVHAAPDSVTLLFSEGVEPDFSTIVVRGADGARFDRAAPRVAPGDDKTLMVTLKPLPAGAYTVEWHATSVDTHKTEGTFTFTVAP